MQSANTSNIPFAFAFAALFFGSLAMGISPVFVRFADVGPFASAFWRVAIALPLLLLWAYAESRQTGKTMAQAMRFDKAIWLAGLLFAGDLFFWHLAIVNTTIANATLLACLAPVWVVLLSGAFIGEPVPRSAYIGLIFCLVGTASLIGSSFAIAPENLIGDIYGLATSLFFGLYFLAVRVARRNHMPGSVTFKSSAVTAGVLLAVALIAGQSLWPQSYAGLAALLALGLISHSFGQGLLAVALGSLSAAFSSLVIFIEALAAALMGWLVFNEALGPLQLAGGLLIMTGVWIARPTE
ncbi:MAG: DMT family transporter [Rhizobiaceae bacterium]